jgi:hypothetical protein
MMGVSEMTVTRHVANDLAGKYRWVHTMKGNLANIPVGKYPRSGHKRNVANNCLVSNVHVVCR